MTKCLTLSPATATAAVLVSFTLLQYAGETTDSYGLYGVHRFSPSSLEGERWSSSTDYLERCEGEDETAGALQVLSLKEYLFKV